MYESKLKRTNKMYSKLTECMNELLLKEKELDQRLRMLDEQQRYYPYLYPSTSRPTVVRAGPRTMRGSEQEYVSTAPQSTLLTVWTYRQVRRNYLSMFAAPRIDVVRPVAFSRSPYMRHSSSSQHCSELVRNSPARTSGMSEDSGVHMWNEPPVLQGGQPVGVIDTFSVVYSQTIFRNVDGRWSDSRIVQRRKPKRSTNTNFQRDSPARIPQSRSKPLIFVRHAHPGRHSQGRKKRGLPQKGVARRSLELFLNHYVSGRSKQRASYPSPMHLDLESCCTCNNENCPRQLRYVPASYCSISINQLSTRARSMIHERLSHSPTSCEDPTELSVTNLPASTSYEEALRHAADLPSSSSEHRLATVVEPTSSKNMGYTNPIFISPVTSFDHPMSSPESPTSPISPISRKPSGQMANVDPNINLFSLDDDNSHERKEHNQSDASGENSTDDEKDEENGNVLDSSLDSQKAFSALTKTSSEEDSSGKRKRELIMLTSSSTMASSLERSLEQGAMHSDGLSDKERRVRAVKNTIRGHRRTQSVCGEFRKIRSFL
ncbi:unnamed protein product [Cylicostephanus goldi]|uniref:Uncharacterized protein n=1 Tax=Cylicostephanus goldi TaxID=71465 RepID=A0A3P6QX57_CYLGO|nr:unnamed protein product [Cylicostephanus goldi]